MARFFFFFFVSYFAENSLLALSINQTEGLSVGDSKKGGPLKIWPKCIADGNKSVGFRFPIRCLLL